MGLIKIHSKKILEQKKYENRRHNFVQIRLEPKHSDEPWYGIQPHIHIFPIFCPFCGKGQPQLFLHTGSRYHHVGEIICEFCEKPVTIWDTDNIIEAFYVQSFTPENKICFSDLYLLNWKYIAQIEAQFKVSIEKLLSPHNGEFMQVDKLLEIIEKAIGIHTDGTMSFITATRFSLLPEDINRWIELLYRANIPIGATPVS